MISLVKRDSKMEYPRVVVKLGPGRKDTHSTEMLRRFSEISLVVTIPSKVWIIKPLLGTCKFKILSTIEMSLYFKLKHMQCKDSLYIYLITFLFKFGCFQNFMIELMGILAWVLVDYKVEEERSRIPP